MVGPADDVCGEALKSVAASSGTSSQLTMTRDSRIYWKSVVDVSIVAEATRERMKALIYQTLAQPTSPESLRRSTS